MSAALVLLCSSRRTHLGKDVKIGESGGCLGGSKQILFGSFGQKLPPGILVKKRVAVLLGVSGVLKGLRETETYVRPRCEEMYLRKPRPMS